MLSFLLLCEKCRLFTSRMRKEHSKGSFYYISRTCQRQQIFFFKIVRLEHLAARFCRLTIINHMIFSRSIGSFAISFPFSPYRMKSWSLLMLFSWGFQILDSLILPSRCWTLFMLAVNKLIHLGFFSDTKTNVLHQMKFYFD